MAPNGQVQRQPDTEIAQLPEVASEAGWLWPSPARGAGGRLVQHPAPLSKEAQRNDLTPPMGNTHSGCITHTSCVIVCAGPRSLGSCTGLCCGWLAWSGLPSSLEPHVLMPDLPLCGFHDLFLCKKGPSVVPMNFLFVHMTPWHCKFIALPCCHCTGTESIAYVLSVCTQDITSLSTWIA